MDPNARQKSAPQEWGTRTVDAYEKQEIIGQGTYGLVYKARSKENAETVALKKIRMENEKEGFPITAIREIKILKEVHHENVIKLKEIVTSKSAKDMTHKGSVYLVFEFMDHDLAGLMDSPGGQFLTEEQIKCYFKQLLEGLYYLHRNHILHRDIKASNLLINNIGVLKLADFGLARPIHDTDPGKYTNKVITLWYRPPELLLGAEQYGPSIDMWSAGCILAELLEKKALFPGHTEVDQLDLICKVLGTPSDDNWPDGKKLPGYDGLKHKRVIKPRFRERFKSLSETAVDLLENLLQLDPLKRMSAHDALDHKYFWTEPLPCPIDKMPSFPSSHEFTSKKRKQKGDINQRPPKKIKTEAGDGKAAPSGGSASSSAGYREEGDRRDGGRQGDGRRHSTGSVQSNHQHVGFDSNPRAQSGSSSRDQNYSRPNSYPPPIQPPNTYAPYPNEGQGISHNYNQGYHNDSQRPGSQPPPRPQGPGSQVNRGPHIPPPRPQGPPQHHPHQQHQQHQHHHHHHHHHQQQHQHQRPQGGGGYGDNYRTKPPM